MTTGRIVDWVVAPGAEVSTGDDLVEIDTDKIVGVLESPYDGVLRAVVAEKSAEVPVGATIAVVAPAGVPEDEIEAAVVAARRDLASGAVVVVAGPQVSTVDVAGRAIAYSVLASDGGPPVVLVHGFGGDKNSWLFVQEPLGRDHTVYAIDLPGHGESAKDVGDGALDTLAGVVLGFLDAVGVERAHLVGHSLGGAVACAVAAAAPARVASLTLLAPVGLGGPINAAYLRGFVSAATRRELQPHLRQLFADEALVNRQLTDDLLRYKRLDGVDAALRTLLGTLLDGDEQAIDVTGRLVSLTVPTTVVWGAADRVIPPPVDPADPADGSGGSGVSGVSIVDGSGHMVHMEAPGAVVAAVQARAAAP